LADAPVRLVVTYTLADGSTVPIDFMLPALPEWQTFNTILETPPDGVSLTVEMSLSSVGSFQIDEVSLKRVQVYVSPEQVTTMESQGHEILSHTRTHPFLTTLAAPDRVSEIAGSRSDLMGMGITSVPGIVYPYGDFDSIVQQDAMNAGYTFARSVNRGFNDMSSDKFALKIQQIGTDVTQADIRAWIDTAVSNKKWLILMYHQVDGSGTYLSTSPSELQATVDYLVANAIPVVTLGQGVALMNP
jgi:hypothetical protein